MAKISTYPIISIPTIDDLLIGTDVNDLNNTKNFTIGEIGNLIGQDYVPYVGATGNVNLGSFNITGGGFIVGGGTASQFLKADGSLDSTLYTPQTRTLTINGTTYNLSANRSWDLNTIDSLTTNGTSGAATYIGKVLNIPVYQAQGSYITQLSGEATGSGPGNASVTLSNSAVINKVLTGLNVTGGTIVSTDTILQAFGKVQNQINGLAGGVEYQGTWNATTNTPFLQSSIGTQGYYYVVDVAGTTNLNGITDWQVGDWAIYNGTVWQKVDNTDAVVSVNGYVGAVVLTSSDVGAVPTTRTLTINGVGYSLSADRSWTVGDVRTDGSYANPSWITSLAWSKITGTPTTLAGYGITDGALNTTTLTINGTTYDLTANRTWNVGTVTSVGTSGPLTGGTITGSGTIGITQSSSTTDGYLSSTDWNSFNSKQGAISVNAPLTFVSGVIGITQSSSTVDGYLSSTDWNTFNSKVSGSGTANTLPMWGSASSLINSPLSYAADTFNFQYNSATGGTVNFTNIGLTTYTYSIQMNNFGSPRSTIHSYTDGLIIQSIGGTQVSRMFANGNLILGTGTVDNGYKLEVTGDLYLSTIANAIVDTDRFIVSDGGVIKYRTGAQILSDIGAQGTLTLTTIGSSGPATLIGDTLNIPNYSSSLTGYVPYTGATQNVNLGEFGISSGYFQADLTPTQAAGVGRLIWNNTDGTLNLGLLGGNIDVHLGQQQYARVVNGTGGNVLKSNYQAVKIIGAQGQRMQVGLARADNDFNSKDTLGLIAEDINNNNEGFVISSGLIEEINTTGSLQGETWTDGDTLYLSGTTFGGLTNIKPVAPIHTVIIGFVVYAHANHGKIFVKVDNGYELEELHDVNPLPYVNNGVLYRDTTLNLWKSATIPTLLGYTPANAATTITINGTTFDLSANRTWSVGTVTSVAALTLGTSGTDLSSTVANGTTTPVITLNVPTASATNRGALSSSDWSTFNAKQNALTLTTTGTSGAATLVGSTLNIPQYQASGTYVNSVTASSPLASSGGVNPNITIQQATATQDGFLSSTDWSTFNNKQNAITLTTTGSSGAATLVGSTLNIPQYQSVLTNPITGTGTTNYLPKFTGSTTIGNSTVIDNGTTVSVLNSAYTDVFLVGSSSNSLYFYPDGGSVNIMTGAGFTGSGITFAGGSNYLDFNTNSLTRMRLSTSGNLLVGTTTDNGARLQVEGTASFNFASGSSGITFSRQSIGQLGSIINSGSEIVYQGTGSVFINADSDSNGTSANREVKLGNRGVTYMTITSSGNVGIGTSSPLNKLSVVSSNVTGYYNRTEAIAVFHGALPTVLIANDANATNQYAELKLGNNQSTYYPYSAYIRGVQGAGIDRYSLEFGTSQGSEATTKMTIAQGGNVLIGTTTDGGARLQIVSSGVALNMATSNGQMANINSTNANGGYITWQTSGTTIADLGTAQQIFGSGGNDTFGINGRGARALTFGTNDTERMRITSGGNVLIGTTTDNGARLQVSGAATILGPTATIGNAVAATNVKLIFNGVASKAAGIEFQQSGTPQWYIGNGIASEDNNFELYNSNGTMAMKIIKSTNAINFIGAATFSSSAGVPVSVTSSAATSTFVLDNTNANLWGGVYAVRVNGLDKNYFGTLGSLLGNTNYDATIWATAGNGFRVYTNGNNKQLEITTTGAATFSGSVTIEGSFTQIRSGNELRFWRADNAIYTKMFDAGSTAANGFTFDNLNAEGFHFKNNGTTIMRMNSSGNVGIGTTSPSNILHLFKSTFPILTIQSTSYQSSLGIDTNSGLLVLNNESNAALGFNTNNTERMRITSGGNVLVGNTSAYTSRLTVQAAAGNRPAIKAGFGVVAGNGYWVLGDNYTLDESLTSYGIDYSSGDLVLGSIVAPSTTTSGAFISTQAQFGNLGSAIRAGNSGDIYFFRGTSTSVVSIGGAKSMTESMRINSSGNVGLGTTNPLTNSTSTSRFIQIHAPFTDGWAVTKYTNNTTGSGGGDGALFGVIGLDSYVFNYEAGQIIFGTSSSTRMTIASNGNVLIGTTTDAGYTLNVAGNAQFVKSGTSTAMVVGLSGVTGSVIRFSYNGGFVGSISTDGSNTAYNTSSDYRLKQDIKDFNGLDLLSRIKPYDFEWKSDKTRSYGVLAHELQEVINYAVTGSKDAEEMQGVDYSKLVPILIKAIQELNEKIK